jgi:hypothetical protein
MLVTDNQIDLEKSAARRARQNNPNTKSDFDRTPIEHQPVPTKP